MDEQNAVQNSNPSARQGQRKSVEIISDIKRMDAILNKSDSDEEEVYGKIMNDIQKVENTPIVSDAKEKNHNSSSRKEEHESSRGVDSMVSQFNFRNVPPSPISPRIIRQKSLPFTAEQMRLIDLFNKSSEPNQNQNARIFPPREKTGPSILEINSDRQLDRASPLPPIKNSTKSSGMEIEYHPPEPQIEGFRKPSEIIHSSVRTDLVARNFFDRDIAPQNIKQTNRDWANDIPPDFPFPNARNSIEDKRKTKDRIRHQFIRDQASSFRNNSVRIEEENPNSFNTLQSLRIPKGMDIENPRESFEGEHIHFFESNSKKNANNSLAINDNVLMKPLSFPQDVSRASNHIIHPEQEPNFIDLSNTNNPSFPRGVQSSHLFPARSPNNANGKLEQEIYRHPQITRNGFISQQRAQNNAEGHRLQQRREQDEIRKHYENAQKDPAFMNNPEFRRIQEEKEKEELNRLHQEKIRTEQLEQRRREEESGKLLARMKLEKEKNENLRLSSQKRLSELLEKYRLEEEEEILKKQNEKFFKEKEEKEKLAINKQDKDIFKNRKEERDKIWKQLMEKDKLTNKQDEAKVMNEYEEKEKLKNKEEKEKLMNEIEILEKEIKRNSESTTNYNSIYTDAIIAPNIQLKQTLLEKDSTSNVPNIKSSISSDNIQNKNILNSKISQEESEEVPQDKKEIDDVNKSIVSKKKSKKSKKKKSKIFDEFADDEEHLSINIKKQLIIESEIQSTNNPEQKNTDPFIIGGEIELNNICQINSAKPPDVKNDNFSDIKSLKNPQNINEGNQKNLQNSEQVAPMKNRDRIQSQNIKNDSKGLVISSANNVQFQQNSTIYSQNNTVFKNTQNLEKISNILPTDPVYCTLNNNDLQENQNKNPENANEKIRTDYQYQKANFGITNKIAEIIPEQRNESSSNQYQQSISELIPNFNQNQSTNTNSNSSMPSEQISGMVNQSISNQLPNHHQSTINNPSIQNQMLNPMYVPMMNNTYGPMYASMMNPMYAPIMNPMYASMMNPMCAPMMNPMYDAPIQNPLQNPTHIPINEYTPISNNDYLQSVGNNSDQSLMQAFKNPFKHITFESPYDRSPNKFLNVSNNVFVFLKDSNTKTKLIETPKEKSTQTPSDSHHQNSNPTPVQKSNKIANQNSEPGLPLPNTIPESQEEESSQSQKADPELDIRQKILIYQNLMSNAHFRNQLHIAKQNFTENQNLLQKQNEDIEIASQNIMITAQNNDACEKDAVSIQMCQINISSSLNRLHSYFDKVSKENELYREYDENSLLRKYKTLYERSYNELKSLNREQNDFLYDLKCGVKEENKYWQAIPIRALLLKTFLENKL